MYSKNCIVCGSEFRKSITRSKKSWEEAKFCSHSCYQVFWKKIIVEKIRAKDKQTNHLCLWCKKVFRDWSTNHRKYCSRKCYELSKTVNQSGKKHWNWRGGITPKINKRCNSEWWKILRKRVYERDNWTCKNCGIKCTSKNYDMTKIQCDHIIKERNGGSHNMNNLQTLCLRCHINKDWKYKENYL